MARHILRDRPQNKYFVIVANSPVMVLFTYANINNILTNDSTTAVILSIIGLMIFSSFYTLLFYTFLKA
ncbi:hypothetical protein BU100_07380 [Staphylococcus xylosus]|uniref:hypothetical protein n=1 Tax=Staphylococcus TaxID=1279 RepID=UPI0004032CD3|nr:hypothetical protein [Staphylococcus xylosus]ARD76028.1 hypothetical protein AWC37_13070 [Staphylococcus xylosus]KTW21969.1 hypothetical protein NS341_08950 [Staphylococcus xylosus]MBF0811060.1 hypothetical protein [Staphylococcus xylosus]MBO3073968.1 hypothetical protein [Staphylococcus xylosus]MBV5141046.1 hypothetical protein [Staphylococcus xylosus]